MKHLFRIATFALGAILGASAVFIYQRWSARQIAPVVQHASQSDISEITLERTGGYGCCPQPYKVILRRDGTATYISGRSALAFSVGDRTATPIGELPQSERARMEGTYRGRMNDCDFLRLTALLESRGFFNFDEQYDLQMTDVPASIITAVRNNQRKAVTASGGFGILIDRRNEARPAPASLKQLERVIDGVVASIEWERISNSMDGLSVR